MTETKKVIDTFKRVEDKYFITKEDQEAIVKAAGAHIAEDYYFRYKVRSIYYDSENSEMVINSLLKPKYKCKLRLRCYVEPDGNTPTFLETKKKYGDIVYKKRIQLTYDDAMDYMEYGIPHDVHNNTAAEIDYLVKFYNLKPAVYIAYDRTCYHSTTEQDVRITFDTNMQYRIDDISLNTTGGEKTLYDGIVMEVKAMDRYPMWLVNILSERKLYKGSYSKYGEIYKQNYEEFPVNSRPYAAAAGHTAKERLACSVQY